MSLSTVAPLEFGGDFATKNAVHALHAAAPEAARSGLQDLLTRAINANIPWFKIMQAFAVAAAGGFTPAALIQAAAILFGPTPAPAGA